MASATGKATKIEKKIAASLLFMFRVDPHVQQ